MRVLLLKALLHRTALLGGTWLVLTDADPAALAPGVAAVAASTWLSLRLLPPRHPLVLWRLARFFVPFVWGSIGGGVDVARRALSPGLKLRPGWVAVPMHLPDGARVALGTELSLMPGTLAAGSHDGKLLVHLLDTEAGFDHAIPKHEAEIAAMINASEP